jgi:hypothetical protein
MSNADDLTMGLDLDVWGNRGGNPDMTSQCCEKRMQVTCKMSGVGSKDLPIGGGDSFPSVPQYAVISVISVISAAPPLGLVLVRATRDLLAVIFDRIVSETKVERRNC